MRNATERVPKSSFDRTNSKDRVPTRQEKMKFRVKPTSTLTMGRGRDYLPVTRLFDPPSSQEEDPIRIIFFFVLFS